MTQEQHDGAPVSPPVDPAESQQMAIERLASQIESHNNHDSRLRRWIGYAVLGCAVTVGAGMATHNLPEGSLTHSMPYEAKVQHVINGLDGDLAAAGGVGFVAGLGAIGSVKWKGRKDPKFKSMDKQSSKEPTSDGSTRQPNVVRRAMQATVAGRIPVMASVGVGLAAFSASVGTEVSDGPQRPIVAALDRLAPGDAMVTEYSGAMPMVESDISRQLALNVIEAAQLQGVKASILNENLGQLTEGNQTLSDLALGVDVPENSPLHWNPLEGCRLIPVGVDKLGRIHDGRTIAVDGVSATVVEQVAGTSATNRIGVVMDEKAMGACLKKDDNAPVHAVVLEASTAQAQQILNQANTSNETSSVISRNRYLQNSKNFWLANVKPITNVLALFSGAFAGLAMAGSMRERLVRNRRELAAKSAARVTDATIRGTELLRATKDGVMATIVGGVGSLATPLVVNMLESGFQAGIGIKEVAVGGAVGMFGSVGGALVRLLRPQKTIKTAENTRAS